jgi:hypothetical protein
VLPQSASSAFLLVRVLVVAFLHRLLQEVHGFGFGFFCRFCGGCLGFEGGHGFGFCGGWGGEGAGGGGWGGEGAGGCGFVTAGAAKDLVTAVGVGGCWGTWLLPWMRWVLGELASAMDMGGCWGSLGKKKCIYFFNNILIECNVK